MDLLAEMLIGITRCENRDLMHRENQLWFMGHFGIVNHDCVFTAQSQESVKMRADAAGRIVRKIQRYIENRRLKALMLPTTLTLFIWRDVTVNGQEMLGSL